MLKAFEDYGSNFYNWLRNRGVDKCELFFCQVIGYSQRYLPACEAQAFVQGLSFLIEDIGPLRRSFNFQDNGDAVFPLTSNFNLGFAYAVGRLGTRHWKLALWANAREAYKQTYLGKIRSFITYTTALAISNPEHQWVNSVTAPVRNRLASAR